MIEKTLLKFLKKELGAEIGLSKESIKGKSYILLERTSGSEKNKIKHCTFAFQSYAPSLFKACELNEKLKTAMEKALNLDEIASVKLDNDYNFTDTETKEYRYQAVFDITYY